MRMAIVFGMNQVISHGFGLFLFAALVPLMRESIAINHWHLALVGALTQMAYLGGAMLLGLVGPRLKTATLALATGTVSTLLLFSMSQLRDPPGNGCRVGLSCRERRHELGFNCRDRQPLRPAA